MASMNGILTAQAVTTSDVECHQAPLHPSEQELIPNLLWGRFVPITFLSAFSASHTMAEIAALLASISLSTTFEPEPRAFAFDHEAFPHLMDLIFEFSSNSALIPLRATCRGYRERSDHLLTAHAVLTINYSWVSNTDKTLPV
jgi:hypothetical protein